MGDSKSDESQGKSYCRTHWPARCFADRPDGWRVIVINASEGGFELSRDLPLDTGELVQIVIEDVGVFPCRVAWKMRNRCGLEVLREETLAVSDPTLKCGSRVYYY